MAYHLLKQLIKLHRRTKEELLRMADIYHAAGRLTAEQHTELTDSIRTEYAEEPAEAEAADANAGADADNAE